MGPVPGAPGRTATDVGTEHRPTRTATEGTRYNNGPGEQTRDQADGPRDKYSSRVPGATGQAATDVGTERRPTRTAMKSTCYHNGPG